jgi:hypothetical protein
MKASATSFLLLIFILSGCGAWANHTAADSMQESEAAYKQCLTQAAGDAAKCAPQKQAFDADLEAYEALRGKRLKTSN